MKGMVNEQPVAVKIYSAKHKHIFLNEKDIYTHPFMDTPEILSYFGESNFEPPEKFVPNEYSMDFRVRRAKDLGRRHAIFDCATLNAVGMLARMVNGKHILI